MKTSFAFWSANRSKPKKFNSLFSMNWKKLPPTVQKQNNKNKIMKRKTRSCSISMRPMHVSVSVFGSVYVCVNGQHLPSLSTFLHALFTWAFLATLCVGQRQRRLHLLSLLFIFLFAAASFHWSLTPQSQAASPACGSTSILSLVFAPLHLLLSLFVCSFDTLRALLLHCFSFFSPFSC